MISNFFSLSLSLLALSRCVPNFFTSGQVVTTCGTNTELDNETNQCLCSNEPDAGTLPDFEDDPTIIQLSGIYDLNSYIWGADIFETTVRLINQGWFPEVQLPLGHKVQYDLRNSACDESTAIRQYWDLRTNTYNNRPPHGVIGARCSGPSTQLARVLDLEGVPQISPVSNTAKLSNDVEFPFFARMVAPNDERGEVGAMIALLREFGWERITLLSTDTQFAKDLLTEFGDLWVGPHEDESGTWTGSVGHSGTILLDSETGLVDEDSLLQVLSNIPVDDPANNSRIIFLAAHSQHAFRILQEAAVRDFQPDTVWVGPSSWVGRSVETPDLSWLPTTPGGYLGVSVFRSRDETYENFLMALQDWQAEQGKDILTELPVFVAETVDAIVAMTMAIVATPDRRNGSGVIRNLKRVDFNGVSGAVRFTDNGDRFDPQYTVINSVNRRGERDIWADVGSIGTEIGSADLRINSVCFQEFGCGLESIPPDTYPLEASPLPGWVIAVIVVLSVLFIVAFAKYLRSHCKKKKIKIELEALSKSIIGMQVATCEYIPKVAGRSLKRMPGDIEENFTEKSTDGSESSNSSGIVLWLWKETDLRMKEHDVSNIYGDPGDCWIKFDTESNTLIEAAYQGDENPVMIKVGAYLIDTFAMTQTNTSTGYQRKLCRVDINPTADIDLSDVMVANSIPSDLTGEPQMILVKGDVVQVSTKRDDGWAFGTKLHREDEDRAQELLDSIDASKCVDPEEETVFTDSGWFQLTSTRVPTSDDLEKLKKSIGRVDSGSLDPPSFWDPIQDATVALKVVLPIGNPERDAVVQSFMSSLGNKGVKVTKVERIQNLSMYQTYVVKRSTICYRETGHDQTSDDAQRKAIERFERSWLWHGSNVEVVGKIINQGFNRSFCGKNATAYGKGVYFARDSSYSSSTTYSVADAHGNQYMLACRVCVGEYCRGRHDALTPDVRDAKTHALYDSTVGLLGVDTMHNPSIYVTYHDSQAYPEYLVTFRST